jgi:uncharacterized membrane protein
VSTYSVVLALHIIAVLAAYGLPLAYPLLLPYVRARHPEALAGIHDVQYRLNVRLTGPGTVLIPAFGIYLASRGHHWGQAWVTIGIVIIVLIAVLGGGVVVPATKRLAQLAREDVRGPEYDALYRRYMRVEVLLGALVVLAVFVMAAKP